jgi:hypothetical protein
MHQIFENFEIFKKGTAHAVTPPHMLFLVSGNFREVAFRPSLVARENKMEMRDERDKQVRCLTFSFIL